MGIPARHPPRLLITVVCGLAFFLLVRGATLRSTPHGNSEICQFGLLAEQLISGRVLALHQYPPQSREVLNIPFGMLCAPVFMLGDPSLLSLRTCAVIWHGLILVVFALLASRVAGWRGAALFALLWTLAPPAISRAQSLGWSVHLESALFPGLAALCAAWMVSAQRPTARGCWAAAAGVLSGLSLFFFMGTLPMVAALILSVVVLGWRRSSWWTSLTFLAGLLLGIVPVVVHRVFVLGWLQSWTAGRQDFLSSMLATNEKMGAPHQPLAARFVELFSNTLPDSITRTGEWGWAPLVCLAVLAMIGIRHRQEEPGPRRQARLMVQCWAVGCIVLVPAAVITSSMNMAPRYLWVIWPLAALLAAASADLLASQGVKRPAVATIVTFGLMLAGAYWAMDLAGTMTHPNIQRFMKGYSYSQVVSRHVASLSHHDLVAAAQRRTHGREELLHIKGRHLGKMHTPRLPPGQWLQHVLKGLSGFPSLPRMYALGGAGKSQNGPVFFNKLAVELIEGARGNSALNIQDALSAGIETRDPELSLWFGLGAGRVFSAFPQIPDFHRDSYSLAQMPRDARSAFCAGAAAETLDSQEAFIHADGSRWPVIEGCPPVDAAIGLGIAVARWSLPEVSWPGGDPRIDWFFSETKSNELQAAFLCGYRKERENLARLARDNWLTDTKHSRHPVETCRR